MLCSWPGRAAGLAAAPTMSLWLTGCVCSQGEDHLILTNPGNMPRKNTVHKTLVSSVGRLRSVSSHLGRGLNHNDLDLSMFNNLLSPSWHHEGQRWVEELGLGRES